MSLSRSLRALAGLAVLWAAACTDNTGPGTITDPATTEAALTAVDGALGAPAVQSFGAVGPYLAPSGLAAATIVAATAPRAPIADQPASGFAALRLGDLRQLAALSPAALQGPIIPQTLYGSVFTWDVDLGQYVRTSTTGGPANGVRFILYAVNPITHAIVVPLVEVGFVDLMDESTATSAKLHIVVQGVGGTPTYLDYLATVTPGVGQVTATVSGFASNGATGGDNKTLNFNVTATLTLTSADITASFTLNNPAVAIQLHLTVTHSLEGQETVTLDFTITHPGETIRLQGLFTKTGEVLDTLHAEIRVNGQLFATVEGNAHGVTFYDKNGAVIEDSAQQHEILGVLRHLLELAEHVFDFIEDLFEPVQHFLGG